MATARSTRWPCLTAPYGCTPSARPVGSRAPAKGRGSAQGSYEWSVKHSTSRRTNLQGEEPMTRNHRFSLNEARYVIDMQNPANDGKGYCHHDAPEDDVYLRERVLQVRLDEVLSALIIPTEPMKKDRFGEYQPFNEEKHSIWWALLGAINASHLNSLAPLLSIQHKFDGKLKREKRGLQDFTSLSLFVDDVECLLRDIYGEFDNQAIDRARNAVFV